MHKLISHCKSLDSEQQALLDRLDDFKIDFVFERLKDDPLVANLPEEALQTEFKKFVALAGFGIAPIAMISPAIDQVWHQLILFTKQYEVFCIRTLGYFLHHLPDTNYTPVPAIAGQNFLDGYRMYFGELPEWWFCGMDEKTVSYYSARRLVGLPPTRWSGWIGGRA